MHVFVLSTDSNLSHDQMQRYLQNALTCEKHVKNVAISIIQPFFAQYQPFLCIII